MIQIQVGSKTIYGSTLPDGRVRLLADCEVCLGHLLELIVTPEQAAELAKDRTVRKPLQEILPNVPASVRELFISGTTPAEWDAMFGDPKPAASYGCYVAVPEEEDGE